MGRRVRTAWSIISVIEAIGCMISTRIPQIVKLGPRVAVVCTIETIVGVCDGDFRMSIVARQPYVLTILFFRIVWALVDLTDFRIVWALVVVR